MKNKCENCGGLCCLDTEMILSKKDVNTILKNFAKSLEKEDFVLKIDGYFQLKNTHGHCVFFDISTKTCKIYSFRPQGCRFYPMIYDNNNKLCVLDNDCPRTTLFYQTNQEFKKACEKIKQFLKEQLEIEI